MYSLQGDVVLDPFLGTGTTMLSAIASGRNSIGIEVDGKMVQLIIDSVINSKSDLNRRQIKRLVEHNEFLEKYKHDKNKEFIYFNEHLKSPVMTRQELDLRLWIVDKIEKIDKLNFKAYHADCSMPSEAAYELTGFDSISRSDCSNQNTSFK